MSKCAWIGAIIGMPVVWHGLKRDALAPGIVGALTGAAISEGVWRLERMSS